MERGELGGDVAFTFNHVAAGDGGRFSTLSRCESSHQVVQLCNARPDAHNLVPSHCQVFELRQPNKIRQDMVSFSKYPIFGLY